MDSYLTDLGDLGVYQKMIRLYARFFVPRIYYRELEGVARILGRDLTEVLIGNLYYDGTKVILGCTAFATNGKEGPLHARNLDWWSVHNLLARHTVILNFRHGGDAPRLRAVGWPGFTGVVTAMAPGRFSVSLNAVLSKEKPAFAQPVPYLIRSVLEKADSYEEALKRLSRARILADCILLLSGTNASQFCVIERTPRRFAHRGADEESVVATNDYLAMEREVKPIHGNKLYETSCGRFDRTCEMLAEGQGRDLESCFSILRDPGVKTTITMQHVVMSAKMRTIEMRQPDLWPG